MAKSTKVINKKYIKDRVYNNLWHLNKTILFKICNQNEITVKKSATKDDLIKSIQGSKKIDFYNIYIEYAKYGFALTAFELEELLGIDKTIRKKMEQKGILAVEYYEECRVNGFKTYAPMYSLLCLYKMKKTDLDGYREKFKKKPLTEKQKLSLELARAKKKQLEKERYEKEMQEIAEATTCIRCNTPTMDYNYLNWEHICLDCENEMDAIARENFAINECKKIITNKDKFLILDIETTDLDYKDICSISIIDLNGNVKLNTLIKPNGNIDIGATWCHKITNENVVNAPDAHFLKQELVKLLEEQKYFLYYNIGLRTIRSYLEKSGIDSSFLKYAQEKSVSIQYIMSSWVNCKDDYYLRSIKSYVTLDSCFENELHSLQDCYRMQKFIKVLSIKEEREVK